MKRRLITTKLAVGMFAMGIAIPALAADAPTSPPAGFTSLFDGQSLDGWHGMPNFSPAKLAEMPEEERAKKLAEWTEDARKHWRVEGAELVNDGHGAYLTTDREFGDIELLVEYKTLPKGDSGVYLRGTPQVQIWDSTPDGPSLKRGADKGSGGLWNNSPGAPGKDPLVVADKPFGEWNSLRILQLGARTTVHLNGQLVVDQAIMENYWDRARPLFRTGPIQLQTHGAEIRWRNLYVREVPAAEANEILARRELKGYRPIFDGKDLDGWAGATESYEVVEGAIRNKPDKLGVLYFDKMLTDFVVRLEFRLPPAGNNGLAIRYAGEGDAAYSGMCELQVLDEDHEKYLKIDTRQRHGSAYGMAASHRGYLRPVGEWNFQEVTVQGSKIKVELNGTVILDTDLSQIHEYLANKAHPGKDRTSGYFGFTGHRDPVDYRNLSLRPID